MQATPFAVKTSDFRKFMMLARNKLPDDQKKSVQDADASVERGDMNFSDYVVCISRSMGDKKLRLLLKQFEEFEKRRAVVAN